MASRVPRRLWSTIDPEMLGDRRASGYTIPTDLSVCLAVITRSRDAPLPITSVPRLWERVINHLPSIASKSRELVRIAGCSVRAARKHIGLADRPRPGRSALPRSLSLRNDLVFLIALSRNTSARCCINEALPRLASPHLASPRRTVVHGGNDVITDGIILPRFHERVERDRGLGKGTFNVRVKITSR